MNGRFKAVRVKSSTELDWVIEHMTHEAYRARDNWDFWGAFESACDEYWKELNETPAFWELTRRAHKDSVVLRLGRLYDPHGSATSLGNLLQTIKDGSRGTARFVPVAIADLDGAELDSDIAAVSDENPTVAKLLRVRNEYLAHRSTLHVTKGTFASLPTLERDEISTLMMRAFEVLEKYRERLGYSQIGWGHQGTEEFCKLLSLVRAGRESRLST